MISRIWSIVRACDFSSLGLATTNARHIAREIATFNRLRELDPERLLYESNNQRPGGSGSQIPTPLELRDRLDARLPPPRMYRYRCFVVLARSAAYGKFPLRSRTAGAGS